MTKLLRINMGTTLKEAIFVMAEGNPGAISALIELATKADMPWIIPFGHMDEAGVYGPRIWMLYKDVFNYDARAMEHDIRMLGIPSILAGQTDLYRQEWDFYGKNSEGAKKDAIGKEKSDAKGVARVDQG